MKIKAFVACCALVALLWLGGRPTAAQPAPAPEKTVATGPSMPGYEPKAPSIYGQQGPPAVPVPGAGGTGVAPANDTSLGRGGIVVPLPPGENSSSDVNAGNPAAGTVEAGGSGSVPDTTRKGRSFPIWAIVIGAVVLLAGLRAVFGRRRLDN